MRGTHGHIAIDLRAELRVLALAASQDRIDQAGCARVSEVARGLDRFGHGRVRGNLRVQQLAQADDRERAHVGLELLTGARQQALEQRIEPQIPANAVVRERAEQAALLARRLAGRSSARHRANGRAAPRPQRSCAAAARTAAERLTIPSTAPSRRCALRNSAADMALRPALCTRVSRSTPSPVPTSMPAALRAEHRAGRGDADESMRHAPPTRATADRSSASPRPATD